MTHSGIEWSAHRVPNGSEILKQMPFCTDIVAVDEMFMIEGSADALIELYKSGKTVLISTLQLLHMAEPFEEVQKILPFATSVEVCPAVCFCGEDAHFTYRIGGGDKLD